MAKKYQIKNKNGKTTLAADGIATGGRALAAVLAVIKDRRFLAAFVLYIAVCGLLLWQGFGKYVYRLGAISETNIVSPRDVEFVDNEATELKRKEAAVNAGSVYRLLPGFLKDVESIFQIVLSAKDFPVDSPEFDAAKTELQKMGLSEDTVHSLLSLQKDRPIHLRLKIHSIIKQLGYADIVDDRELSRQDSMVKTVAEAEGVESKLISSVQDIIRSVTNKNISKDDKETRFRSEQAVRNIVPIKKRFLRKEIIVREGEPITASHLDALRELKLVAPGISWARITGQILLIAFSFIFMGLYIRTLTPEIFASEKKMLIFYILIFLTVATSVVIVPTAGFSGYLLGAPVSTLTIMIAVLLKPVLALVAVPLAAVIIVLSMDVKMNCFFVCMVAALAAYYFSIRPREKDAIIKAGAAVSISSVLVVSIFTLMSFSSLRQALLDIFLFAGLNGFITAVVASGSLPVFERAFNVTTPHRLLELSNPEEPLLKTLLINAPGTYYHSLFVGNLAETVAEAIGADALLVRVACYYHDIGKLKRPYFFTENQMHNENLLGDVSPTLGALVISSHARDGVEMAREHNLPSEIVEFISQHHGTTLISFFYSQAQAEATHGQEVSQERFRYPGPKPQTLEAAVIMLSDSCEAAVRALKSPTPKLIEHSVNDIVSARLKDGQFDVCNITLKQIDTLRITLIKTLVGVYHSRMEYPDLEELKKTQKESGKTNGNS